MHGRGSRNVRRAAQLVAPTLCVLLIVCEALFGSGSAALADTLQLNAHVLYARLAVRHTPPAASSPMPNDAVTTEFGPGSVRLQGTAGSFRLDVRGSTIGAVLAAMGRAFNVHYRSLIPLDQAVSGTYAGSLSRVIGRVLAGYDYTIKHRDDSVELSVLGKHGERALPVAPVPAAVAPVRQVRCGRSAGHRAACRPI